MTIKFKTITATALAALGMMATADPVQAKPRGPVGTTAQASVINPRTTIAPLNFKCVAEQAAACEKICKDRGGSWESSDNSCSNAKRATQFTTAPKD